MNAFGSRAQIAHCLKSLFEVLARELDEEGNRKKNEIKKFDSLKGNVPGLVKYQKDSGIPYDDVQVCSIDDIYEICQKLLAW